MGLFKQMKEMKNVVAAAPAMMQQGQALAASAQAMQAAQMGQMQQAIAYNQQVGQPIAPEHLTAINGVDLPTYAWIGKQVAKTATTRHSPPASPPSAASAPPTGRPPLPDGPPA